MRPVALRPPGVFPFLGPAFSDAHWLRSSVTPSLKEYSLRDNAPRPDWGQRLNAGLHEMQSRLRVVISSHLFSLSPSGAAARYALMGLLRPKDKPCKAAASGGTASHRSQQGGQALEKPARTLLAKIWDQHVIASISDD